MLTTGALIQGEPRASPGRGFRRFGLPWRCSHAVRRRAPNPDSTNVPLLITVGDKILCSRARRCSAEQASALHGREGRIRGVPRASITARSSSRQPAGLCVLRDARQGPELEAMLLGCSPPSRGQEDRFVIASCSPRPVCLCRSLASPPARPIRSKRHGSQRILVLTAPRRPRRLRPGRRACRLRSRPEAEAQGAVRATGRLFAVTRPRTPRSQSAERPRAVLMGDSITTIGRAAIRRSSRTASSDAALAVKRRRRCLPAFAKTWSRCIRESCTSCRWCPP